MFFLFIGLFVTSGSAISFNCSFQNVIWARVGLQYTCTATIEGFPSPIVTNITGNHQDARTDANVNALAISNHNLEYGVPRNIELFFPNLVVLSFSNAGIYQISATDISPFPGLKVLILYRNDLESLESDTFIGNSELEHISLASNQLRHLGPNLFYQLPNLKSLRLSNNICFDGNGDEDTDNMFKFTWDVSIKCPPSFEQFEREILSGRNFQEALNPLAERVDGLEARLAALEA